MKINNKYFIQYVYLTHTVGQLNVEGQQKQLNQGTMKTKKLYNFKETNSFDIGTKKESCVYQTRKYALQYYC